MTSAARPPDSSLRKDTVLLLGFVLLQFWLTVQFARFLLNEQPLGMDFLPMWTAGRLAMSDLRLVYDFAAVTERQQWFYQTPIPHPRPFPYPPSALPLVVPFAAPSFWPAYATWVGAGSAAMLWAVARAAPGRALLAGVVVATAPQFMLAGVAGQSTLLIAAAMLAALPWLRDRPAWAGVLLGAAAAVKPTLLLMAPFALAAGGHWRALRAALLAGAALGAFSLLLFGPELWAAWLRSLPRFQDVVNTTPSLAQLNLSVAGFGPRLGWPAWADAGLRLACLALAAAATARVFARTESLPLRLAAMAGGSILASGYALAYDALLLAPAVALLIAEGGNRRAWAYVAGIVLAFSGQTALAAPGFLIALLALIGPVLLRRSTNLSPGAAKLAA